MLTITELENTTVPRGVLICETCFSNFFLY